MDYQGYREWELYKLNIRGIQKAYKDNTISPVELVSGLIERVEKYDKSYGSFINLPKEDVLSAARQAQDELRKGYRRGPLHGIPFAVKDNIDVAGYRTTCHSYASSHDLAAQDSVIVTRLRSAGAIYMGKLALHEFAFGAPTFDTPFPPARNPWNREYQPGGSSTGCGVAVAAGFIPFSIGTDTGGSVRNPAGFCGIVGLKPTYELLPRKGVFPLSFTLDHVGPLARSVEDLAIGMDSMVTDDRAGAFQKRLNTNMKGLRIGFVRNFHEHDVIAHPEVIEALDNAKKVFVGLGASVNDAELPPLSDFVDVQRIIIAAEAWSVHGKKMVERPELYSKAFREKTMVGGFLSARDYIRAQQQRRFLVDKVNKLFRDYDVLLVANSFDPVCKILDEKAINRAYRRQARVPFSLTGHPAIAQMCGVCSDGMPLSLQLVAPFFEDSFLLSVAHAYEKATEWHHKHPHLEEYSNLSCT